MKNMILFSLFAWLTISTVNGLVQNVATRDLGNLADELDGLAARIPQQVGAMAPNVALAIVQDLVAVTPVDKGVAVSNWQVSFGAPAIGVLPAYFPGDHGSTAAANRAAAYTEAATRLSTWQPGDIIFITNNAPHIRRLNEGWSGQAPAGFIERAMLLGQLAAEGETLLL